MKRLGHAGGIPIIAGLFVANLIWAANPVMTKFMLADFGPLQVAWLRITASAAFLGLGWFLFSVRRGTIGSQPEGRVLLRAALMGAIVFYIAPLLITYGLDASLATHNSLITGLEPVVTIVLAWMILRESLGVGRWLTVLIAFAGFTLLSGFTSRGANSGHLFGNMLLLTAMAGEAMYSIIGKGIVRDTHPVTILVIALVTGALLLTAHLAIAGSVPPPSQFSARSLAALLWVGPIATAGCYAYWLASLRDLPVNIVAFSLFVQPLLGSALGYTLMAERLSAIQWAGGGMIFIGLAANVLIGERTTATA